MNLQPKDIFTTLEFDKILELVERACLGEPGRELVREIRPVTAAARIEQQLNETWDFYMTIEKNETFPISAYAGISEHIKRLNIVDYVLPVEGLIGINKILRQAKRIFKYFNATKKENYPHLYEILRKQTFDDTPLKVIDQVIDEEGEIKPNASAELMRIRRSMNSKRKELDRKYRVVINTYKSKGWLTDSVESFRNGRRVLSVPAEHKRALKGIIHDESTTGKTAFIEPEEIIPINNDLFDLQIAEKREIYRLLKEISATLRPALPLLEKYQAIIVHYDVIQAKARLAQRLGASKPQITDKPHFEFVRAFHPLLFLKNKAEGKETVPFDLFLQKNNTLLVLSGPNAGGKSITMKAVGLLQMMFQAGMLIPVDERTKMGIFEQVFADIGDQQSIEDDLSTYSSHLENMRHFVEEADGKTLLLIDEFGSGTDPQSGGAIAEAILRELNFKKAFGVITTHYSNLKLFAFKTKGIVNAAMEFDKTTLSPTYRLKVGRPGSSFAFEIAEKSGLHKKILKYAKYKTGSKAKAIDELLVDLQSDKKELEDKLTLLMEKEERLDKLIKNYDNLHADVSFKRKKMKLEATQLALEQAAAADRTVQKIIREMRETQKLEDAKKLAKKLKEEREKIAAEANKLTKDIYHKPTADKQKPFAKGDFVRLKSGGATGIIESISKNKAIVKVGQLMMTININDLDHANPPLARNPVRSVTSSITQKSKFDTKIDIRGLRLSEALEAIQDFVDNALINNATELRILHGKGNGILRDAVKNKLKEYKDIKKIWHPTEEYGGNGITMVEFL